jgi:Zn-dependent peptidase ImmA (M78 family)
MLSADKARLAANRLIKKYNSRNPFEIADFLGIKIRYKTLGTQIKAYYFCQSRIKNIVINKDINPAFQRVLTAHELGHERLHTKLIASGIITETKLLDEITPLEIEANTFAAELLIPDETVFESFKDGETFFDTARTLSVPPELLEFKLRVLSRRGVLSKHGVIIDDAPVTALGRFLGRDCGEFGGDFYLNSP